MTGIHRNVGTNGLYRISLQLCTQMGSTEHPQPRPYCRRHPITRRVAKAGIRPRAELLERRGDASGRPSERDCTIMYDGRVAMEMRVRRTTGSDRKRHEVTNWDQVSVVSSARDGGLKASCECQTGEAIIMLELLGALRAELCAFPLHVFSVRRRR